MPAKTFESTQAQIERHRAAVEIQAVGHGLNIRDESVKKFLDHQALVLAAWDAQVTFLNKLLHKDFNANSDD